MALTEYVGAHIGPLPVWGWAAVVGGGVLGYRLIKGGGNTTTTSYIPVPTGTTSGSDGTSGADGVGAQGPAGEPGVQGDPGLPGATGGAGAAGPNNLPDYNALLAQLLNWYDQLNRTRYYIDYLRTTKPAGYQKTITALTSANGTSVKTSTGTTYSHSSYVGKLIADLRTKLGQAASKP